MGGEGGGEMRRDWINVDCTANGEVRSSSSGHVLKEEMR